MHRLPYINESIRLCNYLQQNLSIHMKVDDIDESFRYADICGPFCESNIPVSIFYVGYFYKFHTIYRNFKDLVLRFIINCKNS